MRSHTIQRPVLVGHPFAPTGRGEDIRCLFRAFCSVGYPLKIRDIYSFEPRCDFDLKEEINNYLTNDLSTNTNIFIINGDEVEQSLNHLINEMPSEAYNIIYPQWELSIYPIKWAEQLNRFDEIWAPSRFVFDSIKRSTSKPIIHMPLPVQIKFTSFLGRKHFGIHEGSYLFLFFFDLRSYIDRKNPFAAIKAFERVCEARPDEDVRFIIKINRPKYSHKNNSDFQKFIENVKSKYKNKFIIIDKVFTDNEIKNLVRLCDCFVSLHRSEGFGRGMAEAMFLGKPVVSTGYSGNLDFMNVQNSCLVNYDLIDVEEGQYPYSKGQVWADADIEHAANYMIKLLDDRDYGRKLGEVASRYIRTHFSYRSMGLRYIERVSLSKI